MPKFKLSRHVKYYEDCEITAKSFDDAMRKWSEGEIDISKWNDSGLGEDEQLTAIAQLDAKGNITKDRDVDPDTLAFLDE